MKKLKGSQTEKNLIRLFALESQDRNRYSYFSSQAKKEGFVQISFIFEETANQKKEQAKRLFKFFEGGEIELTTSFSAMGSGSTLENLKAAAISENKKCMQLYPESVQQAKQEGFSDIALVLQAIAAADKFHEKRYLALATNIEAGRVYKREELVAWRCRNCGYVCESKEAPGSCIACAHPQAHFELLYENY